MVRRLSLILAILLLLSISTASFAWKFVSMADSRGDTNGINAAELQKIIDLVKTESPDLVLFQGDAVTGSITDSVLSSQMDSWVSMMNTLGCPWYYTPGNHEIQSATAEANVLRAKVNQPLNGPAGYEEFVYSFDHENAHFVALNSNHWGEAQHVQRAWLANDLAATTQPHIIVMTHEPGFPVGPHMADSLNQYPDERDNLWSIMTNAGVRLYLCGHEHYYHRALRGITYQVIDGSCGAPLHTSTTPGVISAYHYVVVTIDGNNVHCETKNDTGAVIDSWDYAVTPKQTATCDSAKSLPDGTLAVVNDVVVTHVAPGDYLSGDSAYVEKDDRSAAIKAKGSVDIKEKDRVKITGVLQTNPDGEREIAGWVEKLSSGNTLPGAVAMKTSALIGGPFGYNLGTDLVGCNTSSMFVRAYGKVTSIGTGANDGYFYIDDGCGLRDGTSWDSMPNVGVRVKWDGPVNPEEYKFFDGIVSSFMNGDNLCRLILSKERLSSFTAYNDVVWASGHPVLQPNVTTITVGSGNPGPTSGTLKDFVSGMDTGVMATFTQYGGVTWNSSTSTGGSDCVSGSDAYNTFNYSTASLVGVVYYGATTGWYVDLTFTGLDPAKTYEFATSTNRNGGTNYYDRLTKFTISGADAFTNTSTSGVAIGSGGASSTFCTGNNTSTGYVARWTGINPGADGSFSVRAQAGSSQNSAYAFSAFKLVQLP